MKYYVIFAIACVSILSMYGIIKTMIDESIFRNNVLKRLERLEKIIGNNNTDKDSDKEILNRKYKELHESIDDLMKTYDK